MNIPPKHSSLIYEKLINNICRDLFSQTPVSYFNFARFYKNGYVLNLCSKNQWHLNYWKKGYINQSNLRLREGVNDWLSREWLSESAEDAEVNFDICARIEFVKNHTDFIDSFGYACTKDKKEDIFDYYINNLDQLENFNLFFLSEADKVIKKIEKKNDFLKLPFNPTIIKRETPDLKMRYEKSKIYFNANHMEIELTLLQFKVLAFKLRGYSNEQIAYYLNCSLDNIKHHLKNIKRRVKPPNNEEFVEFCIRIGIYSLSDSIYLSSKNKK